MIGNGIVTDAELRAGFIARCQRGEGGLTFAVKDTLDVAGMPTRAGSRALRLAANASEDAAIVGQLLNAGCQLRGKTALHELAFGVTGINPWCGTPVNPLFPRLIPGGSSSGSACVVAAGCVDFAIGTDTGGSVRMPAACCGIWGLKTTFGALSRLGIQPAASSLDCPGFFTRDAATLLQVVEKLPGLLRHTSTALPAIGWVAGCADGPAEALLARQLQRLSSPVHPVTLDHFAAAHQAALTLIAFENWQEWGALARSRPNDIAADVLARLLRGAEVTRSQRAAAAVVRRAFTRALDRQLNRTPLLLLPTLPTLPPTLSEAREPLGAIDLTRLIRPFNLSGHPALTFPAGVIDGRPVAWQLVAKRQGDMALCRHAVMLAERLEYRP